MKHESARSIKNKIVSFHLLNITSICEYINHGVCRLSALEINCWVYLNVDNDLDDDDDVRHNTCQHSLRYIL